MEEIWKDIVGYERLYQVSNLGKVKSFERSWVMPTKWLKTKPEMLLKQSISKENGYLVVSLYNNSKKKTYRVNRLVAFAFIDNPENKPYVNHKNCNKFDNRAENLEWCTNDENMAHAKINKRFKSVNGESHYGAKLNDEQVVEIRKRYNDGLSTYKELQETFGVNGSTLHSLINHKTWKHIN